MISYFHVYYRHQSFCDFGLMIIERGRTPELLQLCFFIYFLSVATIGRSLASPVPLARLSSPVHHLVTHSQTSKRITNLVLELDVMSASAESVQALQVVVEAMQTEQGEI